MLTDIKKILNTGTHGNDCSHLLKRSLISLLDYARNSMDLTTGTNNINHLLYTSLFNVFSYAAIAFLTDNNSKAAPSNLEQITRQDNYIYNYRSQGESKINGDTAGQDKKIFFSPEESAEPTLLELVKRTLRQASSHSTNGYIMTIVGGDISDIANPHSDLMQAAKFVTENTDDRNTLIVITRLCSENNNGLGIRKTRSEKIPVYARGKSHY